MLRLSTVRLGRHGYYLEPTMSHGSAPATEAPGRWSGEGAAALALAGDVAPEAFGAVMSGRHPHVDELLRRRPVSVCAYDLTFCAPKSVSLLHALSEADVAGAVQRGHERAVEGALGYLERRALAVRRPTEDAVRVPAPAGAVASAAFLHRTSRALDPHLHTHVVVANLGAGPEGRWSAVDGRGIFAHAGAAAALYHAQLRHELTAALGVSWEPPRAGRADICGIGPEARREFSTRAQAIADHLAERGLLDERRSPSPRAAAVAGHVTRPSKDLLADPVALLPAWRERALAVGLGPRRLEAILGRTIGPRLGSGPGLAVSGDDRQVADTLVAGRGADRPFARRDVVRAVSASAARGAPVEDVERAADRFMAALPAGVVHPGRTDGPGVAELRYLLPGHMRGAELDSALERRGIDFERGRSIGNGRGNGHDHRHGRARGLEVGLGFG